MRIAWASTQLSDPSNMLLLFFLSSGLFLGWSLGANDASNIFGTAVGTRMVSFRTAAIVASIFLMLGAVMSGAGTSHTLGKLGSITMIGGAFMVSLSAALTVFWMTKLSLPVSTSQAIVGAIIGWNLFAGVNVDYHSLSRIAATWILSPPLAALFSFMIYQFFKIFTKTAKIHMFQMDAYTRMGLIVVGAFGAYSLGANNIANVVGVFIPVVPFPDISFWGMTFSSVQQLFLLGSIAIAAGIFTYSKRVMMTVGLGVVRLNPPAALVVVLAQALVLFLFASRGLEGWLASKGLPTIPLVPLSSSQVVIGAVLGIGIAHGGKGIQFSVLRRIAFGWVSTPAISAVIAYVCLFILQNVFDMRVV